MSIRKTAAIVSIAAMAVAACSGSGATSAPSAATSAAPSVATSAAASVAASAAASGCKVGMSWFTFQEERYGLRDEPALKAAIAAGGGEYIGNDAKNSAETQAANVEALIAAGINVLVVDAFDSEAIKPSVAAAEAAGIPVIAYDRLIEDPNVLYLTHDNVEVGRMMAREIMKVVPKGAYAIIKGDKANPNSIFVSDGFNEIIGPAVTAGDITIGGEQFTDSWKPDVAQTNMEQILSAKNNKINAVLSENDGMAGGVVAALAAQGLDGKVAVSGQDGDAAGLNRVALGTQTIDVWKNSSELGTAAGQAAIQLCKDKDVLKVAGTSPYKTPGGNTVSSILLKPIPITKDNLNVVLDAKWIDAATLCKGVKPGSVPACT
jgi:D-xylose transport system substrate-binding protein